MTRYNIISADTHLEISPGQWTPRLPASLRDRGPRVIELRPEDLPEGLPVKGEGWICEGVDKAVPLGMNLAAGKKPADRRTYGWYYHEDHIGAGDATQRLREMNQDSVDAEVEYAAVAGPGFLGRIKDHELYLACVQAYNDYLGLDFCAQAPDRLWGLAQIPMSGLDNAMTELRRTRDHPGIKGWQLGSWPSGNSYPTPDDDAFWELALDLDTPITAHVTFSGDAAGEPKKSSGQILEGTGAPLHSVMSGACPRPSYTICQMIVSGVFDRFPDLRIHFAETGAGWAPYFMEHSDLVYQQFGPAKGVKLHKMPSEYFRSHVLLGFQTDHYAIANRHLIGVGNMAWGNDFPHSAGDWPESHRVIKEQFEDVPNDERREMLWENTAKFYRMA